MKRIEENQKIVKRYESKFLNFMKRETKKHSLLKYPMFQSLVRTTKSITTPKNLKDVNSLKLKIVHSKKSKKSGIGKEGSLKKGKEFKFVVDKVLGKENSRKRRNKVRVLEKKLRMYEKRDLKRLEKLKSCCRIEQLYVIEKNKCFQLIENLKAQKTKTKRMEEMHREIMKVQKQMAKYQGKVCAESLLFGVSYGITLKEYGKVVQFVNKKFEELMVSVYDDQQSFFVNPMLLFSKVEEIRKEVLVEVQNFQVERRDFLLDGKKKHGKGDGSFFIDSKDELKQHIFQSTYSSRCDRREVKKKNKPKCFGRKSAPSLHFPERKVRVIRSRMCEASIKLLQKLNRKKKIRSARINKECLSSSHSLVFL